MMRFFQCSLILIALLFYNLWEPESALASTNASFEIGSTNYYLNGSGRNMDVSPYVKDGRTFMPILYVAQALGISGDNVLWDGQNRTVTLMKADKIVQVKIGSITSLVNGTAINMDVGPEISNGRTCLPVALVAQAFGATVSWDAATQTIRLSSDLPNDSTPPNTIQPNNPQTPEPSVLPDLTGTWHSPYSIIWITQIDDQLTATVHDTSKDWASADWSCTGTVSWNTVTIDFQQNTNSNNTIKGTFDLQNNGNRMEGTMVPSSTNPYHLVIERATPGDLTGIWHSAGSTFWIIQKGGILTGRARANKTNDEWSLDGSISGNMVTINFDDKASSGTLKGVFDLNNNGNVLEGTMTPSWTNSYSFIIQR